MTNEVDEAVRARLDEVAAAAPAVGFTAGDVVRRGRRRRQLRRGAVVGASAAALALVVAVPTVALRGTGGPAGVDAASPARTTPAPVRTTAPRTRPTQAVPIVPGMSAAEAARLASRCALFSAGGDASAAPRGVRVYNVVRDALGTHAAVYGPNDFLSCDVESGGKVIAGMAIAGTSMLWLPGYVAVDNLSAAPGGPKHSGSNVPDTRGYDQAEGRVSADVASVVFTAGSDRVRVPAVNGTFSVRILHSLTWEPPANRRISIEVYAASGRRLTALSYGRGPTGCWVTPTGDVLSNKGERTGCRPAVAWP